jgi:hypothetical protein
MVAAVFAITNVGLRRLARTSHHDSPHRWRSSFPTYYVMIARCQGVAPTPSGELTREQGTIGIVQETLRPMACAGNSAVDFRVRAASFRRLSPTVCRHHSAQKAREAAPNGGLPHDPSEHAC